MIKDKPYIKTKDDLIEINHGRRFPLKKSYLLYLCLLIVLVIPFFISFSSVSISFQIVSALLAMFMITANTGIILDNNSKVKFFMSAFGFQIGNWKKFNDFSCLVLKTSLKKRENVMVNQYGDGASVTEKFQTTELYLMDSTHRKKILCGSFDSYKEAKEFAKEVSSVMNLPIEKFSPIRTQRRR